MEEVPQRLVIRTADRAMSWLSVAVCVGLGVIAASRGLMIGAAVGGLSGALLTSIGMRPAQLVVDGATLTERRVLFTRSFDLAHAEPFEIYVQRRRVGVILPNGADVQTGGRPLKERVLRLLPLRPIDELCQALNLARARAQGSAEPVDAPLAEISRWPRRGVVIAGGAFTLVRREDMLRFDLARCNSFATQAGARGAVVVLGDAAAAQVAGPAMAEGASLTFSCDRIAPLRLCDVLNRARDVAIRNSALRPG